MDLRLVSSALEDVYKRVEIAKRRQKQQGDDVCIVAVSKTKPKSMIIEAYNYGHRHFGENYVNELVEKASDSEILEMCPEIKWHFIGHLQSNKVNKLIAVPNLYMLQTIDSKKLADIVDKAWSKTQKIHPLKIMIQVNTSGEESKSGISLDTLYELTQHVIENCHHLNLVGFMTIGYAEYDLKLGPNPEFLALSNCRERACQQFNLDPDCIGLSMGMSHDFEHAIESGSTCVRIGSSIFGSRVVNP